MNILYENCFNNRPYVVRLMKNGLIWPACINLNEALDGYSFSNELLVELTPVFDMMDEIWKFVWLVAGSEISHYFLGCNSLFAVIKWFNSVYDISKLKPLGNIVLRSSLFTKW